MPTICFDLEGPLSPQDNAYEIMGLIENGRKIFEAISRYDDILTLEGRKDYEPGDTLKLILPFLIYHRITEREIETVSKKARIVHGAKETISALKKEGWKVHIISTSYQQHAYNIGRVLGAGKKHIACTKLPLDRYAAELENEDFTDVKEMEYKILHKKNEAEMIKILDKFFFNDLPKTPLGKIFRKVSVVGGKRKVEALLKFAEKDRVKLNKVVAVGDSITDYKMLKKVKEGGGLAIVFNGNEYALPYADIGVAALDMRDILPITAAFSKGGKKETLKFVKSKPKNVPYQLIKRNKLEEIIQIHKKYRKLARGEAAKLG